MTDAPETIFVNTDDIEDGCCPVEEDEFGDGRFYSHETATKYRRADLAITPAQLMADPQVEALVEALEQIAHMGFDMPATLELTDDQWRRRRTASMQAIARTALAQPKETKP